jgi:hypothetical protein
MPFPSLNCASLYVIDNHKNKIALAAAIGNNRTPAVSNPHTRWLPLLTTK